MDKLENEKVQHTQKIKNLEAEIEDLKALEKKVEEDHVMALATKDSRIEKLEKDIEYGEQKLVT